MTAPTAQAAYVKFSRAAGFFCRAIILKCYCALFSPRWEIMELRNDKRPGGTIDSWCGKCKMILAHTIEALVGDKPVRVHCNTCQSQHSYKPNAPGVISRPKRHDENGGSIRHIPKRGNAYRLLMDAKESAIAKIYSPKEKYQPGDVLEHSTFGRGVAMALKDETKIEVLFESGSKTLIHGR